MALRRKRLSIPVTFPAIIFFSVFLFTGFSFLLFGLRFLDPMMSGISFPVKSFESPVEILQVQNLNSSDDAYFRYEEAGISFPAKSFESPVEILHVQNLNSSDDADFRYGEAGISFPAKGLENPVVDAPISGDVIFPAKSFETPVEILQVPNLNSSDDSDLSYEDAGTSFPAKALENPVEVLQVSKLNASVRGSDVRSEKYDSNRFVNSSCATVEEMGEVFAGGHLKESLRVRTLIQDHFSLHGAHTVRGLPPEKFCRQGFVMGKASEAGLGNEMYKILTAAGLSIMLNRSLIIGQTRGKFPFERFLSYTNLSFTLKEVKHLWRRNDCVGKYGRRLVMRIDNFEKPSETNVLCSNWMKWKQPIIWFQETTDAVAAQFFLKSVHSQMSKAATLLFGRPENLDSRPNVFGELMRVIISPSVEVEEAVSWVLNGGHDPHIAVHMRMLMNRSPRAVDAALDCIKTALVRKYTQFSKPLVVLVSDMPSLIKDISSKLQDFAEVIHFDYKLFEGNISGGKINGGKPLAFRVKDWGPAPRWVAFVDFFLASRAKHAVVSGAHRRVGTTYAQLIAALAAAHQLDENYGAVAKFSFLSSFQSNLLSEGLRNQVGWGHVWNRFAGPLSCRNQLNQCALTPLLPPAWWDGTWQSPIPRDIRRLEAYGIKLSVFGNVDTHHLQSFCKSRKNIVKTIPVAEKCSGLSC